MYIDSVAKFTILRKAVAWPVVRGLFLFLEYIFFFLSIAGIFFVRVFKDVRNIQMVSLAVCQISILDEYVRT
jgi:hypothetical protein